MIDIMNVLDINDYSTRDPQKIKYENFYLGHLPPFQRKTLYRVMHSIRNNIFARDLFTNLDLKPEIRFIESLMKHIAPYGMFLVDVEMEEYLFDSIFSKAGTIQCFRVDFNELPSYKIPSYLVRNIRDNLIDSSTKNPHVNMARLFIMTNSHDKNHTSSHTQYYNGTGVATYNFKIKTR